MLSVESPVFEAYKCAHASYYHGISKSGFLVSYERIGILDLNNFLKESFNVEDAVS